MRSEKVITVRKPNGRRVRMYEGDYLRDKIALIERRVVRMQAERKARPSSAATRALFAEMEKLDILRPQLARVNREVAS